MPKAIQGSGGSTAFFARCVTARRGYDLTEQEALPVMRADNAANCEPPFSDREVVRKVKEAANASMPLGFYLPRERPQQTTTRKAVSSTSKAPSKPAAAPSPPRPYTAEEHAQKLTERNQWSATRPTTGKERGLVGYGRNCPVSPADTLAQNGLLLADDTRPDCYVLADRAFRQYRKFDGSPFHHGKKADNAKGSLAKGFFCAYRQFQNLEADDLICIVEGAIGLLECVSIQWLAAPHARRWKFLAAHSSSSRFFYEPQILKAIAGHHVRIMPDPGKTGIAAARAWRDELRAVGCRVDFAAMPPGFQDLKVILAAGSDGVAAARSILTYPTPSLKGGQP